MSHRSSAARRNGDFPESENLGIDIIPTCDSRQGEYTGTHALMLAVLEEGIRSFLTGKGRIQEEAEFWIFSPTSRALFSFAVVCDHLGLNPEATRHALRRLSDTSDGVPTARSRPNVSRSRRILR